MDKNINSLRDYLPLSQNLQEQILTKEYSKINDMISKINIVKENKFFITQVLRQTFPHRKNISIWEEVYKKAINNLNINTIETFRYTFKNLGEING